MRIGWIEYYNTLPFKEAIINIENTVVKGVPSTINELLYKGKLDIGIISSAEYIHHFDQYFILSDLSISSYRKVYSVVLVSDEPIEKLDYVLLSKESKTSNFLVQVIFYRFLNKKINIGFDNTSRKKTGRLLIGDKALTQKGKYRYVYDLSDIWFSYTQLPFVFALWCVRKDFYKFAPEDILIFKKKLKISVDKFFKTRVNFLKPDIQNYLCNLDFSLSKEHILSLKLFSSYLKELNLIEKTPEFSFI